MAAGFESVKYPHDLDIGPNATKLSVTFMPFRIINVVESGKNFKETGSVWKNDDAEHAKSPSDKVLDTLSISPLSGTDKEKVKKVVVSLPLPNSSLSDTHSHNWAVQNVDLDKIMPSFVSQLTGKLIPSIQVASYSNSSPRNFTFNFQLMPQNHLEAVAIQKIIWAFKAYSSPGSFKDLGLINPYGVKPIISPKNSPLAYMLRLFPCVIKSVNVTYFDNGQVITYKDGMPKSIALSIGLEEMMVHTKQTMGIGSQWEECIMMAAEGVKQGVKQVQKKLGGK